MDSRVPPHDLDAELALLASLLLDPEPIGEIGLNPEDFYDTRNRTIYTVMQNESARGGYLDVALLAKRCEDKGVSREYLVGLSTVVRAPTRTRMYAERVLERALARRLLYTADKVVDRCLRGDDASEVLDAAEASLMALGDAGTSDPADVMTNVATGIFADMATGRDESPALTTGFVALDYTLGGGLRGGQLIIVAGRPSMGKSSLAKCMAARLAAAGTSVGYFSMEEGRSDVASSIISILSGTPLQRVRSGQAIPGPELEMIRELAPREITDRIYLDDRAAATPAYIRSQARRMKRRHGVGALFVDYMQLMEAGLRQQGKREGEISYISRNLKALARELNVPVIALCQLNRKCEERTDKRPLLSDLRESGSIEQDADVVLLVYREHYYTKLSSDEKRAEVHVAKQRNGPTDRIGLDFFADRVTFCDMGWGD